MFLRLHFYYLPLEHQFSIPDSTRTSALMLDAQIQQSVRDELELIATSLEYRSYRGDCSRRLSDFLTELAGTTDVLLASSGTAAVEIALRGLGISPGDRVLISGFDYTGNFWAIERVGARPVLVDVEANSWKLSAEDLERAVADQTNEKPKALIASHLYGELQNAVELRRFCDNHGLYFIEDACQAIGARVCGMPVGSVGDVGVFSFGGGKTLSAGRGGAAVTSDQALVQRMRLASGAGSGPYSISELQSAVVLGQARWLQEINDQCRNFFGELSQKIGHVDIEMPWADVLSETAFYQAGFLMKPATERHHESVVELLKANSIQGGAGFPGLHRRSPRRCDRASELQNVPNVARNTWVIHHRVAFEGRYTASDLSELLLKVMG